MVTLGVHGIVCISMMNNIINHKKYIRINIPITSSVILSLAITDGLVLMTTSHWIIVPSSVVLNCEIV